MKSKYNNLYHFINIEVLLANKTLTSGDSQIQFLDPNGADRTIGLPPEADVIGAIFYIANSSAASDNLNVYEDSLSTLLGTVGPGEVISFFSNGTDWNSQAGSVSGSGTDNRITRWNGTTALQDSLVTLNDTGDILSTTNDTQDLGSNTLRWQDIYLGSGSLHIGTNTSDEGTITYNTGTNNLTIANVVADGDITLTPGTGAQILAGLDGDGDAPAYSFTNATDTGIYYAQGASLEDVLIFVANGSSGGIMSLSPLFATVDVAMGFDTGTAADPSITFQFDTSQDTGFYRPAEDEIGIVAGGVEYGRITDNTSGVGIDFGTQVTETTANASLTRLEIDLTSSANDNTDGVTRINLLTDLNLTGTMTSSGVSEGRISYGVKVEANDTGNVTAGSLTVASKDLYGIHSTVTNSGTAGGLGTTAKDTYAIYGSAISDTNGNTVAYGIYGAATGADTNWSGYFDNGNFHFENQMQGDNGSEGTPTYSFTNFSNTGIYCVAGSSSEDTLIMTADDTGAGNGNGVISISDRFATINMPCGFSSGTASDPAITFEDDTSQDTGIYRVGEDEIGFSTGGTLRFSVNSSGHVLPAADDTYDLGSGSFRWRDIYLGPASIHIGDAVNEGTITFNSGSNELEMAINGSPAACWNTSGLLGVGGITPTYLLHVDASTFTANNIFAIEDSGSDMIVAMTGNLATEGDLLIIIGDVGSAVGSAPRLEIDQTNDRFTFTNSPLRSDNGSESVPTYSFTNFTGTGMYCATGASSEDVLILTADDTGAGNGNGVISISDRFATINMPCGFADGSTTAPSITFESTNSQNTGFYRIGDDNFGITINGTGLLQYNNTGMHPITDDTYDLGTNTLRWQDIYLGPGTLHIGTSTLDEGTISYNTTTNNLIITNVVADGDITITPGTGAQILAGINGSNSAPVYSFTNDGDTGFYNSTTNTIGVATNGTLRLSFDDNGILLPEGNVVNFGSAVILQGSGHPEGNVTANPGSIYLRTTGVAYLKESGTGNTGWDSISTLL